MQDRNQDHNDDDNQKIYVKDVYPNLVTLLVMKSAGHAIKCQNGKTYDMHKFLNDYWFRDLSPESKKVRDRQWLKPCRIMDDGKIENRDENGKWSKTGSTIVLKSDK